MLGLFQEEEISCSKDEANLRARALLISSLNKGVIPCWDHFFKELPALGHADDLIEIKENFKRLTEWPFLEEILKIKGTEYFLHSIDHSQVLSLDGKKQSIKIPIDIEDWQLWLEVLSIHFKQNWNNQNPFVSFYGELFGKTYRLSMVHASTSPGGISKLIIRSLATIPHPIESFGNADYITKLVDEKKNILIAGSTGSGKTSFLTTLIQNIGRDEHLVILEDTLEILTKHPFTTRFIAGKSDETSLKSYLTYSLRLSPDRIILGEMRSHEVIPFLMAMNTGHKGLMGTLHASSAHDALHRVALLFTLYSGESQVSFDKVMELLCRNLEYVVFMENKKVKEVIKILGSDKGVAFYETITEGGPEINLF